MSVWRGHCRKAEVKRSRKADREAGLLCAVWTGHLFGWVTVVKRARGKQGAKLMWQANECEPVPAISMGFMQSESREGKLAIQCGSQCGSRVEEGDCDQPTGIQSSGQNNIILLWKLNSVSETNQIISQLCHWWLTPGCFVKDGWLAFMFCYSQNKNILNTRAVQEYMNNYEYLHLSTSDVIFFPPRLPRSRVVYSELQVSIRSEICLDWKVC